MSEVLLSAFNPSTMSPQLLEAIFVEREPLVQELLSGIRGSLSPTSKAHALVLGPRGMGKTHLVSLIYHRIREGREGAEGLDEHLRVAWLREEERGIATFFHLLRRIIMVLAATYKDPALGKRLAALAGSSPRDAQALAERLLVEWLEGKTLLLLVENFEDMLHRMGEPGQQAFRAFLQNRSCCLILATAPTLTAALSKQTAPFYNFFNLYTLEEFRVETVRGLIKTIAEQRGDTEFADFLETPVATERLRAIEDLAGGHPRIWILFAGFLTKEILDDLVPAIYKLVDELTPYYQSKMEMLPGQEALIVETLCEKPGAMPVKELAEACFLAPNIVSAHLNDLSKRGYVRSEKLGRESYYELREPLLRIWIQVKGDRNSPVRLIVEFIKRWFTLDEIKDRYGSLPNNVPISHSYYVQVIKEVHADYLEARNLSDYAETIFQYSHDPEKALIIINKAIDLNGQLVPVIDWFRKGNYLYSLGRWREALGCFDKMLELELNNVNGIKRKADCLMELEESQAALELYKKISELCPQDAISWNGIAIALCANGDYKGSVEFCNKALGIDPDLIAPMFNKAMALILDSQWAEAVTQLRIAYLHCRKNRIVPVWERYRCQAMLRNTMNIHYWPEQTKEIINLCKEFDQIERWGEGLVQIIPLMLKASITNRIADAWLSAWQKAGAGHEELEIPLRMLEAAVEWKKTRSRAALLRLEPELRSKLESLLPPEASVVEAKKGKTERALPGSGGLR